MFDVLKVEIRESLMIVGSAILAEIMSPIPTKTLKVKQSVMPARKITAIIKISNDTLLMTIPYKRASCE